MLKRAVLELRLELAEGDAVLAEWENLDEETRQRLRSRGYRLDSDAT
jgi:hypothetical protein